jgi:hypothetical protein
MDFLDDLLDSHDAAFVIPKKGYEMYWVTKYVFNVTSH